MTPGRARTTGRWHGGMSGHRSGHSSSPPFRSGPPATSCRCAHLPLNHSTLRSVPACRALIAGRRLRHRARTTTGSMVYVHRQASYRFHRQRSSDAASLVSNRSLIARLVRRELSSSSSAH